MNKLYSVTDLLYSYLDSSTIYITKEKYNLDILSIYLYDDKVLFYGSSIKIISEHFHVKKVNNHIETNLDILQCEILYSILSKVTIRFFIECTPYSNLSYINSVIDIILMKSYYIVSLYIKNKRFNSSIVRYINNKIICVDDNINKVAIFQHVLRFHNGYIMNRNIDMDKYSTDGNALSQADFCDKADINAIDLLYNVSKYTIYIDNIFLSVNSSMIYDVKKYCTVYIDKYKLVEYIIFSSLKGEHAEKALEHVSYILDLSNIRDIYSGERLNNIMEMIENVSYYIKCTDGYIYIKGSEEVRHINKDKTIFDCLYMMNIKLLDNIIIYSDMGDTIMLNRQRNNSVILYLDKAVTLEYSLHHCERLVEVYGAVMVLNKDIFNLYKNHLYYLGHKVTNSKELIMWKPYEDKDKFIIFSDKPYDYMGRIFQKFVDTDFSTVEKINNNDESPLYLYASSDSFFDSYKEK